jgi:hypothetical protein
MGGSGSTRWGRHDKARIVENSLAVDLVRLRCSGLLDVPGRVDQLTWSRAGKPLAEGLIGIVGDDDSNRTLAVCIALTIRAEPLSAHLRLVTTHPHPGGVRWFLCPDCERRALKLYVSSEGDRIACRTCLGLTYRSAQEHDARVDLARRDPEGFRNSRERLGSQSSRIATLWILDNALRASIRRRGRAGVSGR